MKKRKKTNEDWDGPGAIVTKGPADVKFDTFVPEHKSLSDDLCDSMLRSINNLSSDIEILRTLAKSKKRGASRGKKQTQ